MVKCWAVNQQWPCKTIQSSNVSLRHKSWNPLCRLQIVDTCRHIAYYKNDKYDYRFLVVAAIQNINSIQYLKIITYSLKEITLY